MFPPDVSKRLRKLKQKVAEWKQIKVSAISHKVAKIKLPHKKPKKSKSLYPPGTHYVLKKGSDGVVEVLASRDLRYFGHFINEFNEENHNIRLYFDNIVALNNRAKEEAKAN